MNLLTPERNLEITQIAEAHAARDRETLARLIREGQVKRDRIPVGVAGAGQFVSDMRRRVETRNLAIRPKRKGRR